MTFEQPAEQQIPGDPTARALAKLLVVTHLAARDGIDATVAELSVLAQKFVQQHAPREHDHAACNTCNQIYSSGYRTGYMHAGGDTSKLLPRGKTS